MSEKPVSQDNSHWLIIAIIVGGIIAMLWYSSTLEEYDLSILLVIIPMTISPFLIIWGFNKLTEVPAGQNDGKQDKSLAGGCSDEIP